MENWEKQLKFIKVKSDGYIYDGNGDVIAKLAEGRTSNFYNAIDAERESAKQEERDVFQAIIDQVNEKGGTALGMILKMRDYLSLHQNNNEQGGK